MNVALSTLLPEQSLPSAIAAQCVSGLRLDSRHVQPGDGFIAVPGVTVDGRKFIDAAIHAGAAVVLADAPHESVAELSGVPIIGVPNLQHRVGEVAGHFYGEPAKNMQCFAVTGTNGKSSTTWFLRDALNALEQRCGLVGTLGMQFGNADIETGHTTPDAITLHAGLAKFRERGATMLAIEASSHALEQSRLVGVPISVAVFTNLSRDHLDYHGDMDQYFAAKAKLFSRSELQLAVINDADDYGKKLVKSLGGKVNTLTFGTAQSDIVCSDWQATAQGMQFELQLPSGTVVCSANVFGRFNLENLMAVAAVLHGLNYSAEDIARGLSEITPVPGRMQAVNATQPCVLVDYAHTPDGLEKALTAARDHFDGQLWCVVGCGGNRDAGKRPQMAAIAESIADHIIFTSDNPRFEEPQAILADMLQGISNQDAVQIQVDRARAIAMAIEQAGNQDVVLIAGKGHESWQEIRGEKIPMDDCLLAQAALQQRGAA